MFKVLIFLILLAPSILCAEVFLGLGASTRFVKDDENNFESQFPVLVYGGLKDIPWAFALETLYYKDNSTSGGSFRIESEQYEVSAYALRFFNYQDDRAINPYAVGGIGTFQERIESNFLGALDKDKSSWNTALKLGAGGWAQLGPKGFVNLEVKGLYSKDYSPELIFDLSARAGLEF